MSHPDRVTTNSGFDLDFHIFHACKNLKCKETAGDTAPERDETSESNIKLFLVQGYETPQKTGPRKLY